jgi:hypothetical protein
MVMMVQKSCRPALRFMRCSLSDPVQPIQAIQAATTPTTCISAFSVAPREHRIHFDMVQVQGKSAPLL